MANAANTVGKQLALVPRFQIGVDKPPNSGRHISLGKGRSDDLTNGGIFPGSTPRLI